MPFWVARLDRLRAAGDMERLAFRLAQRDIMDTLRADGRPRAQWPRLKAGYSDDLGTGRRKT